MALAANAKAGSRTIIGSGQLNGGRAGFELKSDEQFVRQDA